jgi:hypothetical protein
MTMGGQRLPRGLARSRSPSPTPARTPSPAPTPSPTRSSPPPGGAWCTASVQTYPDSDHDEWYNDVYVNSNQSDASVTASGDGYSHRWWTNESDSAVVYLDGPPPGTEITSPWTVQPATRATGSVPGRSARPGVFRLNRCCRRVCRMRQLWSWANNDGTTAAPRGGCDPRRQQRGLLPAAGARATATLAARAPQMLPGPARFDLERAPAPRLVLSAREGPGGLRGTT